MCKRIFILIIFLSSLISAQQASRKEFKFPEVPGYVLMKCDLHIHTVFSDGNVWPTIRVQEAWRDGLDAIAITDHFEYTPHKNDIPINFNRSTEIARSEGAGSGIIIIQGGEVTRKMPPGHLNAIFLQNNDPLKTDNWMDALKNANDQGAFIFYNHPGWKGQQPDGVSRWYDEHTQILNNGYMHAVEIVNTDEYYPDAHKWAVEKNLTIVGNSDTHDPIGWEHDQINSHRPVTIVLSKEATEEGIKEGLKSGRTMVYHKNLLIGNDEFLRPFFSNSFNMKNQEIILKGKETQFIQITNKSEISYELELAQKIEGLHVPEKITLIADRTVIFPVRAAEDAVLNITSLQYNVKNLIPEPYKFLKVGLPVKITKTAGDKALK